MVPSAAPGQISKTMCALSAVLILLFFAPPAIARTIINDQVQIPGSPNPIGSGARALGMGGAFIAVADDATAASWNPGGLIQLEKPEISAVGAYFNRSIDTSFRDFPEASHGYDVSETRLNYFSLAYPFQAFRRNMTVSLNYQNLYDFTNRRSFPVHQTDDYQDITQTVHSDWQGSLSAVGLAGCIEIIPDLSVGITLNFWQPTPFNDNKWKTATHRSIEGNVFGYEISGKSISRDVYAFTGFNLNLGVLWNISNRWTLGAVIKTPFKMTVKHTRHHYLMLQAAGIEDPLAAEDAIYHSNERMTMPLSYGLGVACRLSDSLTVSADIYRTEWGGFILEDGFGRKTSPVTGTPKNEADIGPTHQLRLGAEYLFIRPKFAVPVRAGVFYDPSPARKNPDDYFGISLGSGLAYGRFIFDIAFQHRFGNDVGDSISSLKTSQNLRENTVYSSLILHF